MKVKIIITINIVLSFAMLLFANIQFKKHYHSLNSKTSSTTNMSECDIPPLKNNFEQEMETYFHIPGENEYYLEEYGIFVKKNKISSNKILLFSNKQSAIIKLLTIDGKYREDCEDNWHSGTFNGSADYVFYIYGFVFYDNRIYYYNSSESIIWSINHYVKLSTEEVKLLDFLNEIV